MNDGQRRFTNEYVIDCNATQAAIRAGYSKKTARSQGQRLLTKADVAEAIQAAQAALAARNEVTQDEVVAFLRRACVLAELDEMPSRASTALANAAYKLAQVCGVDAPQRTADVTKPRELPSVEDLLNRHKQHLAKPDKLDS